MTSEMQLLLSNPIFEGLQPKDFEGVELLWEIRDVSEDTYIWYQGEPAKELAIVIQGELKVEINRQILGKIEAGELAVFTDDFRSATVVAYDAVQLLVLPKESLQLLRSTHEIIYNRLLNSALKRLGNRIRLTNIEIAKRSKGTDERVTVQEPTWLGSMLSKLSKHQVQSPPSAVPALRKLPGLKSVHPINLKKIMEAMKPLHIQKGKPLVLEGDSGSSAFLLVEGVIEVFRNVRRDKAQHLASLYPGALLGTGSLILGERRNASCVASQNTEVWVYEISRRDFNNLVGEPSVLWREALLASLAFQLRNADEILVLIEQGKRPDSDYDKVRRTLSGY